jgi:hypothetical protein
MTAETRAAKARFLKKKYNLLAIWPEAATVILAWPRLEPRSPTPSEEGFQGADGDTAPSIPAISHQNLNEINAINFLRRTYQRRPLLPYLCVMAGRRQMSSEDRTSPEEKMRESDAELVDLHQEVVRKVRRATQELTLLEQTRLIAAVALTARRLHGVLGADDRRKAAQIHAQLRADSAAADASVAKARARKALAANPPANENAADATLEMEMDDDSGRTPERVAALDADLKRRLAALERRREAKGLVQDHVLVRRGAPGEERARDLGPASDATD